MVKYNNLKILDANSVGSKSLTSTMRTTNSGGKKKIFGDNMTWSAQPDKSWT